MSNTITFDPPIRMVDTLSQYEQIQSEVDAAVLEVIRSGQYIGGEKLNAFRDALADYLNVPHVIPCANGTDALQIALMALDLEPGDEIITPAFTYIATVEVIALLRLKPVFVEIDPDTFNISVDAVAAAITPRTKVIMPVHLFGQPAHMEPLKALAQKHGLSIVEDTAQAIGADYHFSDGTVQKVGTIGTIGTTSFYPSKNLGAYGDGGAIFTRNEALGNRLATICRHGADPRNKYLHTDIGVNSRLDAIQAAILEIKLRHLNAYTEARRAAAARYDELLADEPGLILPRRADYGRHVFHQYTLRIRAGREKRDSVQAFLKEKGVPSMIYYPVACHLQAAYQSYGYKMGDLPVSEQLTAEVLSLPMHSELKENHQSFIVQQLKGALRRA